MLLVHKMILSKFSAFLNACALLMVLAAVLSLLHLITLSTDPFLLSLLLPSIVLRSSAAHGGFLLACVPFCLLASWFINTDPLCVCVCVFACTKSAHAHTDSNHLSPRKSC